MTKIPAKVTPTIVAGNLLSVNVPQERTVAMIVPIPTD